MKHNKRFSVSTPPGPTFPKLHVLNDGWPTSSEYTKIIDN